MTIKNSLLVIAFVLFTAETSAVQPFMRMLAKFKRTVTGDVQPIMNRATAFASLTCTEQGLLAKEKKREQQLVHIRRELAAIQDVRSSLVAQATIVVSTTC